MKDVDYSIDGKMYSVSIPESLPFQYGQDEILSRDVSDITFGQAWYDEGYSEEDFLSLDEFNSLKKGLAASIKEIIEKELLINVEGFELENYHHYVKNDADHFKIVSKTRDLFAEDFCFPIMHLMPRLEKILGFKLTDIDPKTSENAHIIVRINRPNSNDYNPPHKDIYEGTDGDLGIDESYIPQFMNFWIPVAGVTKDSSLPLAPKTHRLNEKLILRTFEGGRMQGNKYRVRMLKSWDGDNNLIRSSVKDGQVLIFSSHLIHGFAINNEPDITRVALEFRLFKSNG